MLKTVSLSLVVTLLLSSNCFAVVEFVVTVNKTGEDYGAISTASEALNDAGDIRDTGSVKCGSWDVCVTGTCNAANLTDGESVTWDGGSSTGTLRHITNANGGSGGDQYMLTVLTGTLADDDEVGDGTNVFRVNGAPDSCQVTIELFDDDGVLDEAGISINGFTTDADNFVKVTVPAAERHSGDASSGATINLTSGDIRSLDDYTVFEWFVLTESIGSGTNGACIRQGSNNNITYQNLIVTDCNNGGAGVYDGFLSDNVSSNLKFYNNIIINSEGEGFDDFSCCGASYKVYNSTIYNSGENGFVVSSLSTVKNSLSIDNNFSDYVGSATLTTCGSGDATGSAGLQNLVATTEWVDPSGGDLHLKSGATSIDAGTDLGTDANIDIDGRDRDAEGDTWDLGADEFVSAGGGADPGVTSIYGVMDVYGEVNIY